jgi:hypothetical protein
MSETTGEDDFMVFICFYHGISTYLNEGALKPITIQVPPQIAAPETSQLRCLSCGAMSEPERMHHTASSSLYFSHFNLHVSAAKSYSSERASVF